MYIDTVCAFAYYTIAVPDPKRPEIITCDGVTQPSHALPYSVLVVLTLQKFQTAERRYPFIMRIMRASLSDQYVVVA
jgi:hypothetical protein